MERHIDVMASNESDAKEESNHLEVLLIMSNGNVLLGRNKSKFRPSNKVQFAGMKSRSVVGRICCEAHQVDVVNRKKKLSERKKYQISSLSISVTRMLMEVVGSL